MADKTSPFAGRRMSRAWAWLADNANLLVLIAGICALLSFLCKEVVSTFWAEASDRRQRVVEARDEFLDRQHVHAKLNSIETRLVDFDAMIRWMNHDVASRSNLPEPEEHDDFAPPPEAFDTIIRYQRMGEFNHQTRQEWSDLKDQLAAISRAASKVSIGANEAKVLSSLKAKVDDLLSWSIEQEGIESRELGDGVEPFKTAEGRGRMINLAKARSRAYSDRLSDSFDMSRTLGEVYDSVLLRAGAEAEWYGSRARLASLVAVSVTLVGSLLGILAKCLELHVRRTSIKQGEPPPAFDAEI